MSEVKKFSDQKTIFFVVILSVISASILALLASVLQGPQEAARTLDRSKELLLSAQIYTHSGHLQLDGNVPAKQVGHGYLEPGQKIATKEDILGVYQARVRSIVVNRLGKRSTYAQEHLDENTYLLENKKTGFGALEWLPVYEILPNPRPDGSQPDGVKPECYVIPVAGFGLWDFIVGFIAIRPDGKTVQGISWYEQKETPGLGANIVEQDWQSQFPGKLIFQVSAVDKVNMKRDQIGVTVVRGKVKDVLGNTPKALSAVDGMAGATLTGNGVTRAYKDSLEPYRAFFETIAGGK